ncbi:MAG: hypothetical protein HY565_03785 [Candidatus Kerfeldbacteria bacterium]|nr:hypothetical protein [Candidatus Kerfeldbacteria bacterium]
MSLSRQPHFLHWVIILLLTVTVLFSGYGVVNLLLLRRAEQFTVLQQNSSATTDVPVVTALPVGGILSVQWFDQYQTYAAERTRQLSGIANQVGVPLAPTHISATDTALGNRVLVVWSEPLGQVYDGVELARSQTETMATQTIVNDQVLPANGEWFDLTVKNDQVYYYRLRSYRRNADQTMAYSDWSEVVSVIPTDSTPPAPPVLLTVTSLEQPDLPAETTAGILVTWQASPSSDVALYRLYRSTTPGQLGDKVLTTSDATVTSARDTTIAAGITYYYTVTAVDAAHNESSITLTAGTFGNNAPFVDSTNDD